MWRWCQKDRHSEASEILSLRKTARAQLPLTPTLPLNLEARVLVWGRLGGDNGCLPQRLQRLTARHTPN